ncbi:MAG TPA: hypothetical protein PKL56_16810 [Cyclobacteriaceae bacterium]|nr:hypothetical protein [Cyclobacteriaceae bacterium]HMV09288.1 hypothetical protein [Cyclobacteriaceae bacterium]HMX01912.1 hypothetical protein [Cyclobacteriaceae bacterium]HMX50835.1 hypothetical protein [Cyclobacteriaceae bacterium]HMY94735.1 hypothetical protein [Cyclobacteriaceae bacterium]
MEKEHGNRKYLYFVDGVKYEHQEPQISGAAIKVKLPEERRAYPLYLEGHGNEPDLLITEDSIVSLEHGAKHLYTVPAATFGMQK